MQWACNAQCVQYLKIWEVFSHEAVDLTDRQTSCFAVLQSHKNQDAAAIKRKQVFKLGYTYI